jgi:hypothetical protein
MQLSRDAGHRLHLIRRLCIEARPSAEAWGTQLIERETALVRLVRSLMVATYGALILGIPGVLAEATPERTVEPTVMGTPEAASPPEAPFGLKWLASKQEIAQMGISLKDPMATEFGDSYVVGELPKDMADLEYAVLSFGDDDQLIRITAIGVGFPDDHDGSRIKARYNELEQLLQKKYGTGRSQIHIEKDYDGDRFELGLRAKKNWMYTEFFPRDMRIELSAFVQMGGQTQWRIIFEYVPGMERLRHQRKQAEEHAL